MAFANGRQPAITLVDDDYHSARLMTRTLEAYGAPPVTRIADPDRALEFLAEQQAAYAIVVIDLKASSTATGDFVRLVKSRTPGAVVVAMAPSLDRHIRDELLAAGAVAVFERHADIARYRSEAASIVDFWARQQRLERTGT